jgi:hypothetical protein
MVLETVLCRMTLQEVGERFGLATARPSCRKPSCGIRTIDPLAPTHAEQLARHSLMLRLISERSSYAAATGGRELRFGLQMPRT